MRRLNSLKKAEAPTGSETIKKPKKIKPEYVIAVILVIAAVLIVVCGGSGVKLLKSTSSDSATVSYDDKIEKKLKNLISQIDGAGKTTVFVSLSGGNGQEILKTIETVTENGVKKTTSTAVTVGGKPYVIRELNPEITGVAVVCEGGDVLAVKIAITEVITTTLGVSSENVRILKMK